MDKNIRDYLKLKEFYPDLEFKNLFSYLDFETGIKRTEFVSKFIIPDNHDMILHDKFILIFFYKYNKYNYLNRIYLPNYIKMATYEINNSYLIDNITFFDYEVPISLNYLIKQSEFSILNFGKKSEAKINPNARIKKYLTLL